MLGIVSDPREQLIKLTKVCKLYKNEYEGNRYYKEGSRNHFGPGFGYIEAQALHSVVRYYKPRKIIEVGSGVSTYCMFKASELNGIENKHKSKIICIEPFPSEKLLNFEKVQLIPKPVQTIPFRLFETLGKNDLLFIDSSHTVKAGGDVNFLILEVLPRLKPGVVIHFHDIYFPYDYQRDVLNTFLFWSETSLLHAYLAFNPKMKILFCLSQLHYDRQKELKKLFPEYRPQKGTAGLQDEHYKPFQNIEEHFPSSIYLQVKP